MSIADQTVPLKTSARREGNVDAGRYLAPLGRALFGATFLSAVPMHLSGSGVDYAVQHGVPLANVLVPISGILALLGGLSVLLGYQTRIGALLLALFLIPVTLMMHKFWEIGDPAQREVQQVMFVKNVSMLGTTLLLMYFGSGPVSVDMRRSSRKSATLHGPRL